MRCLSLCHTVVPTVKAGEIRYEAESPDEGALVNAARRYGYELVARSNDSISITVDGGQAERWTIMAKNEFSSKRKCMSMLLKSPDGRNVLWCKGADSVMCVRFCRRSALASAASAHTLMCCLSFCLSVFLSFSLSLSLSLCPAPFFSSAHPLSLRRSSSSSSFARSLDRSIAPSLSSPTVLSPTAPQVRERVGGAGQPHKNFPRRGGGCDVKTRTPNSHSREERAQRRGSRIVARDPPRGIDFGRPQSEVGASGKSHRTRPRVHRRDWVSVFDVPFHFMPNPADNLT